MTEQTVQLLQHRPQNIIEQNEDVLTFELPFHQEATSAFLDLVGEILTDLQFVKSLMIISFASEL